MVRNTLQLYYIAIKAWSNNDYFLSVYLIKIYVVAKTKIEILKVIQMAKTKNLFMFALWNAYGIQKTRNYIFKQLI